MVRRPRHHLSALIGQGICLPPAPTGLHRPIQPPAGLPPYVPPSLKRAGRSTGILTRGPSPTPCGLGLGSDSPWEDNLAQEPLDFRRGGFTPPLALLMPTFSLPSRPRRLAVSLRPARNAPLPSVPPRAHGSVVSVCCLSPIHFRRHITRPVSCYAFFQGWLLLSQPPGCLGNRTTFPTEQQFRDLNGQSGLFPSRP